MGGQKVEEEIEFMPKHTVLVVDDESAIREMLSISLDAADFNVLQASNAQQAVLIRSPLISYGHCHIANDNPRWQPLQLWEK